MDEATSKIVRSVATAVAIAVTFTAFSATAQPDTDVDTTSDPDELAEALLGDAASITVTGADYIGADTAVGTFEEGPFGMDEGLVISNGDVQDMPYTPLGYESSTAHNTPGHALCDPLTAPSDSYDAAVFALTFDVDDDVDGIQFEYTVGSDEYPQYVGQDYNDGFGVFLNGENVALDNDGNDININGPFFSGDTVVEWPDTEMNFLGSTPLLSSQAPVWPGSTDNVLEIVLCDAGDAIVDTGAFLTTFEACFGDCDGTSVCGNGVVEPGEQCDLDDFLPEYAECPEGYEGTPMCNNDPDNPDGDGSCTVDEVPDGCNNIDYCADPDLNDCSDNAICTDLPGANYECECIDGYSGDGFTCTKNISIDQPQQGAVINDTRPTISGTGEPGGEVTVFVDGEEVGTADIDDDGNWEFTPDDDLDEGEVTVEVTDGYSEDDVDFEIDATAPTVQWTHPEDGAVYDETPDPLEGEGEPGTEVEVVVDGEYVGTTTVDEDGTWSLEYDEELDDGSYQGVATATDEAGNTAEATVDFTIDSTDDLLILQPQEGDVVQTSTPTVTGTAEPGADIDIIVDGEVVGTTTADEDGNWSWQPDDPMEDGEVTVRAQTDSPAGTKEDEVTFEIDTGTTEVSIDTPERGALTNDDTPDICGTAAPGADVDVSIDGEHRGSTTADENGQWCFSVDEPLDDGDVTVEVTADDDGNTSHDDTEFTVDTTAPFLLVVTPDDGEVVAPVGVDAIGEAEPDADIDVYLDGEFVGDTAADEDEHWEVPLGELDRGRMYDLRVTATDEAGNTAEVEHPFLVEDGYISGGGPACASGGETTIPALIATLFALFALAFVHRRQTISD